MYCKKCGEQITPLVDKKPNPEIKTGEHLSCGIKLRCCNYCGERETPTSRPFGTQGYVFCQPLVKNCANLFFEELKKEKFKPYAEQLPKFNEKLQGIFLSLIEQNENFDEEIIEETLIHDINLHDGYIVVYHDSDGRTWYKKIPDNIDVLKYVVKTEHRVQLGMGCNQYISCVIYKGEEFKIEIK